MFLFGPGLASELFQLGTFNFGYPSTSSGVQTIHHNDIPTAERQRAEQLLYAADRRLTPTQLTFFLRLIGSTHAPPSLANPVRVRIDLSRAALSLSS